MVTINPNIRTHYIAFYLHKSRSLPFTIDYTTTSIPDVSSLLNLPDHLYSIFTEISTAKHSTLTTLTTLLTLIPTQNLTTDTFPFFYSNPIFVGLLNKNKIDPTIKEFYNQSSTTHASFIKEFFNLKKQTEESGTLQHTLTKFKKYSRVVTRFPPEPSGYLHLGHAKAALLNYYFATQCNGTLRLRFDDTNPLKEEQSYVDCIIEDLKLLGINEYTLSYTSDHFDTLIKYAKELIKRGKAYCDDTDVETMRMERNNAIESKNRNKSIDENLDIFESMLKGENRSCLRAKINMESKNKALCDPVLYRYIEGAHHRTGTKYFIYPTYDFACPIVDSIEDITCALRTNEYRDRNEQYYWVLENLGLRLPDILDFSKLVFENTVLSKRRLKALTESEGIKWDDPRMPTLRGIRRLGMKMDALKNYILLQGMNDKITKISWDKIWAFNKKELEKTSKKYFAIEKKEAKEVLIANYEELIQSLIKAYKYIEEEGHINYERIRNDEISEKLNEVSIGKKSEDIQECEKDQVNEIACKWSCELADDVLAYIMPYNPKNLEMGTKTVYLSKKLFIANENYSDGEEITLMNLGNFIIKDSTLEFNPNGDVKKTKIKTQWVSEKNCEFVVNVYDSLFVNDEYNKDSKEVKEYIGEKAIEESQEGCVLQFERDGFYFCDKEGFNLVPFTKQLRKK